MNAVVQRMMSRPEFGPFVLLVAMIFVFWQINPAFLSVLNIGNMLAFTVELGLIALAMTLLMTAGRIRPFGRLVVRILPGAHVDPVQHRGYVY